MLRQCSARRSSPQTRRGRKAPILQCTALTGYRALPSGGIRYFAGYDKAPRPHRPVPSQLCRYGRLCPPIRCGFGISTTVPWRTVHAYRRRYPLQHLQNRAGFLIEPTSFASGPILYGRLGAWSAVPCKPLRSLRLRGRHAGRAIFPRNYGPSEPPHRPGAVFPRPWALCVFEGLLYAQTGRRFCVRESFCWHLILWVLQKGRRSALVWARRPRCPILCGSRPPSCAATRRPEDGLGRVCEIISRKQSKYGHVHRGSRPNPRRIGL